MNRNIERGYATRDRLVDVATRLFTEQGYDGTSIEAVLREAGVSRGSLYHHFSGKGALFGAVLERVEERVAELAEATPEAREARDPFAGLRAGCLAFIRLAGDPMVRRIMLIDAPAVLGWERWRERDEQHTLSLIRAALGAAAAAGRLDPRHVDMFAHIVLAAVNEVALVIARADDQPAAVTLGETAFDEFLRRLLHQPAES